MMKILLLLLLIFASDGVTMEKVFVKSGEMVALHCQRANVTWKTPQNSSMWFTDMKESMIILNASVTQEGNYSCSQGTHEKTFDLMVCTPLSKDCEYSINCYSEESCELNCPSSDTLLTSENVTWRLKDGRMLSKESHHFERVKESDQGIYTCIRSILFKGHVYNKTFTVQLNVTPKEAIKTEWIVTPRPGEVSLVDVGSPLVINCTGVISSQFSEVYWQFKDTSCRTDRRLRVHCVQQRENTSEVIKMTQSLIFKEVAKEDLSTVFTCKLESTSPDIISVNVTLSQKVHTSYVGVTISTVVITVVMISAVIIYIKYKINVTLYLRDTLGCHSRVSDGKSFDACVMYYKSESGAGLSEEDRKTLEMVLEDQFGYSLCLFNRDVLPGKAVADAVLECVGQSRTVLLVPASPDLGSESALLSAIHEALVERQTRLVLIKNKLTEKTGLNPLSETLQLLTDLGHSVTWRGSLAQSSFFWKHLRYYLPPIQKHPKISLLPQTQTV